MSDTCGKWMPRAGEPCARGANHGGDCWTQSAVERRNDRKRGRPAAYNGAITQRAKAKVTVEVFAHYGKMCVCCGATDRLSVDHVAGDGSDHTDARGIRRSSSALYFWLRSNGYPDGYQTLCRPCNTSKGRGLVCGKHGTYLGGTNVGMRVRPSNLFDAVEDPSPVDWGSLR